MHQPPTTHGTTSTTHHTTTTATTLHAREYSGAVFCCCCCCCCCCYNNQNSNNHNSKDVAAAAASTTTTTATTAKKQSHKQTCEHSTHLVGGVARERLEQLFLIETAKPIQHADVEQRLHSNNSVEQEKSHANQRKGTHQFAMHTALMAVRCSSLSGQFRDKKTRRQIRDTTNQRKVTRPFARQPP